MKFLARLFCFLFGHVPGHVVISFEQPNGSTVHESKDLLVIQPAPGCNPLVMNCCRRCEEPVRHKAREAHYAKLVKEAAKKEAEKKEAAEKPLPPSPAPFDSSKPGRKLRAVKPIEKKPETESKPAPTEKK